MRGRFLRKCNKEQDQKNKCQYFKWTFVKESSDSQNGKTVRECTRGAAQCTKELKCEK